MADQALLAEAEEIRRKWQAARAEYETAKEEGRPAAEIAKLNAAQTQLKGAYLTKAKAAVDAGLTGHSKLPPMSFQEWLAEFRVLHDKARSGTLSDNDAKLYKDSREELAAALVQAQRLTRKPEESAREALRVARAVQVDLELNSGKQRVVTLDICIGGFSTMMGVPPEPNEGGGVAIRMPRGKDHPIVARAKIVATKRQAAANHRVSFAFEGLPESDAERLSILVFDTALSRLGGKGNPPESLRDT